MHPDIDSLALAALALPELTQRERTRILNDDSGLTIGDAVAFSQGDANNMVLAEIFNTRRRKARLERALKRFQAATAAWAKAGDQRVALRARRLRDAVSQLQASGTPDAHHLADVLDAAAGVGSFHLIASVLSVSRLTYIRGSTRRELACLYSLLGRASLTLDIDTLPRPWDDHFPRITRHLPIYWLYQFNPTSYSATVLQRATRHGLRNVGHLSLLSPAFLERLRRCPASTPWSHLFAQVDD